MKKLLVCLLALVMSVGCAGAEEKDNRYDELGFYGEPDMWPVQRNGLWGFVDRTGALVVPCEWEDVGGVEDGCAVVQRDGLWGAIDREDNLLVPCEWESLVMSADGGYTVFRDGYSGALAADGSMLMPCDTYSYVGPVLNGARHISMDDSRWGVCTETGEVITECQWMSTGYFEEGLAWVRGDDFCFGYINEQGELVIPCSFAAADDFCNGSAVVRIPDVGWQLIDKTGQLLCAEPWDSMEAYSQNDLLLVEKDGRFGFINRLGEVVIPVVYDNARSFSDGVALVMQDKNAFWINETGAVVLERPAEFKSYNFWRGAVCIVDERGLYGLMDKQGSIITPCQWEGNLHYAFAHGDFAVVTRNGQDGFLTRRGELLAGRMYDQGAYQYSMDGSYLFLLADGVLSIWNADGTQVY